MWPYFSQQLSLKNLYTCAHFCLETMNQYSGSNDCSPYETMGADRGSFCNKIFVEVITTYEGPWLKARNLFKFTFPTGFPMTIRR